MKSDEFGLGKFGFGCLRDTGSMHSQLALRSKNLGLQGEGWAAASPSAAWQ